jgi:hypothetical protein
MIGEFWGGGDRLALGEKIFLTKNSIFWGARSLYLQREMLYNLEHIMY